MTRLLDKQLDLIVYSVEIATFSRCFDWAPKCCAILRHCKGAELIFDWHALYSWVTWVVELSTSFEELDQPLMNQFDLNPHINTFIVGLLFILEKVYETVSTKILHKSQFIVLWFLESSFFQLVKTHVWFLYSRHTGKSNYLELLMANLYFKLFH